MTTPEPDSSSSPVLDVDRVEWVPGARGALQVRVFGSWRGTLPSGLAFLLIDDERHRHMFPALTTPPTPRPGQWSAAFPVPGELRPLLNGPLAMRVGIDEVVLPPAQAGATQEPEPAEVVDRAVLAERRARRAELAEEELARRAVEAERAAAALEAQLGGLEERLHEVIAERDAARTQLHQRDRALLTATQREHAERALREEAEEERHKLERALGAELADARARLAEAEERAEEADQLRARVAEADDLRQRMLDAREERNGLLERLAAVESERTELAGRLDATQEQRGALTDHVATVEAQRDELAERLAAVEAQREELAERVASLEASSAPPSAALTLVQTPADQEPLSAAAEPAPAATTVAPPSVDTSVDLAGTLRREIAEERARREEEFAALRGDLTTAVAGLRAELAALAARGIAVGGQPEPSRPSEAPESEPPARPHVDRAQSAQLSALAEELERARPRREAGPGAEGLVADLGAAARRLRENGHTHSAEGQPSTEAPAPAPAPEATAFPTRVVPDGDRYEDEWLAEAVEAIAADDTPLAAEIVTALLPAQRHIVKRVLRYDLTLEGAGTLRVELGGGEASVEPRSQPTPGADGVDFRVAGPVRAVARLATGSTRWRLRGARVEGSRWRLWRLLRALRAPLSLAALARGGERLDPGLVFTLLARAVDRRWTDDHPLAVTYRLTGDHEAVWHVATTGGAPLTVTKGAPDEVPEKLCHAVVELPEHAFLPLVAREPLPDDATATVTGDPAAAARLHAWFDRVQGLPIEG
ncbi:MAG TPA: hypothetical protein VGW11_08535 [Solirubrobacteraceae bacterium]|nr:hypothetical protein [Solirubrobacteraceae bacterium]